MSSHLTKTLIFSILLICNPAHAEDAASVKSWQITKASQIPRNQLPAIFGRPYQQPLASGAWEDGLYISRDGLALYSFYIPADVFKALSDKSIPLKTYMYSRGPDIGQDFSNPIKKPFSWLHADIAYSTRATTSIPFASWKLSKRSGKYYNIGAPQGIQNAANPNIFDYFVYTTDQFSHTTIMMMKNVGRDLAGSAKQLPANVTDPSYNEDNPHIERYDTKDPSKLVLFFDSDNWKGGIGAHDLYFSLSNDSGNSWSDPKPVTSLNTSGEEEQPHLYNDRGTWWLYFTAINPADHKLSIYRAQRGISWDSWYNKQLVVSAGTAQAVGEPSLTAKGDLSFVVSTRNPKGTSTDQYDLDPWFMPHL